jgi:hypothetical protein
VRCPLQRSNQQGTGTSHLTNHRGCFFLVFSFLLTFASTSLLLQTCIFCSPSCHSFAPSIFAVFLDLIFPHFPLKSLAASDSHARTHLPAQPRERETDIRFCNQPLRRTPFTAPLNNIRHPSHCIRSLSFKPYIDNSFQVRVYWHLAALVSSRLYSSSCRRYLYFTGRRLNAQTTGIVRHLTSHQGWPLPGIPPINLDSAISFGPATFLAASLDTLFCALSALVFVNQETWNWRNKQSETRPEIASEKKEAGPSLRTS